jgi:N-acetylglutamate synthase-like GNAT family acetyltransferase
MRATCSIRGSEMLQPTVGDNLHEQRYPNRMSYELVKVKTESDWREYHALRRHVLWEARGRSGYDDTRPAEYIAANTPLLLKLNGRPIGTTRLDDLGGHRGVVRLVAIATDLQRQGHGRVLSELVEGYARRLGLNTLFVNAAPDAVGYYEKMGWDNYVWDETELTGIASDCTQMTKALLQKQASQA